MSVEIKAPVLPESITDATILTWHKKPGETVRRDENLVDLETDKVVLEVPAPADGVLQEILKPVGTKVTAEEILGTITAGAVNTQNVSSQPASTSLPMSENKAASTVVEAATANTSTSAAGVMGPAARRLVGEHALDATQISGSGKDGRITRQDVQAYLQQPAAGERVEQRVPMTRLRARVAERLLQSQRETATLTTFNEINLKAVMDLRARYKDIFEKAHGVRLGFMSFFTRAVVEALKRFPVVNASIDGNDIVYHGYYDVGIAVSTERGLVVPVLRDADKLNMAQIEKKITEFGQRAKNNQLTLEEITGGNFTITNGGTFGSLLSTPILNPPQSAILGMHKIEERPIAENGQVVIRPMMYVALSYDHRLIDGKDSVRFLVTIKELLEDPTRLLLDL